VPVIPSNYSLDSELDTKLYNMSTTTKDCLPLPPPDRTFPVQEALTEPQQDQLKNVLAHFSKADFTIPGLSKGDLLEEEKFWLVRKTIV
jgi:hypothetical protein